MQQPRLSAAAKKARDYYAIVPDAPILRKEFGYYCLDRWIAEGHLKPREAVPGDYYAYLSTLFGYDGPGIDVVYGLGGCEAALCPVFETKVLEDRGEYELVQDFAGRKVLYFKGRRNGFMPEYLDHPVKDRAGWEREIKWRMDPDAPGRDEIGKGSVENALRDRQDGVIVSQMVVGGYMYLRSLIGPEALLYMFYDDPALIHECMKGWFELADAVIARHQKILPLDELFLSEDICYKTGALISPEMMREFLFPYYQQLFANMKARDPGRHIFLNVDTDGHCESVIPLYRELGLEVMSPFEVASDCDVVAIGQRYPDLRISGGIDKRCIAAGGDTIKRHLEAIMPAMRRRGGYIPTCDHGVPEETSFENYLLYRRLMNEYCG